MKSTKGASAVSDDDKWRAEDDMRTLLGAIEIRKDAKRMAAVRKLAQVKVADIKKLSI